MTQKILIRFNKTRGQPGRGTMDHVWRVFVDGKEYLAKDVKINVPSWGEKQDAEMNIACTGRFAVDRETATVFINPDKPL